MQKHEKIAFEAAQAVAKSVGGSVEFIGGGKHPHLVFRAANGRSKELPIPSSPGSDATCQGNFARQKATRVFRELMAEPANDNADLARPDPPRPQRAGARGKRR